MNLRELEYLVAVADHRHFGRAAEACHVSQPTLSTQLKKLETELGVQLVERDTRHVLLTAVGHQIVQRARVLLAERDTIAEIARRGGDPANGQLRLGMFPTLGPYLLPHVVPALHARYPQLELLLVEEKTDVLIERLTDGMLDAALMATPIDADQFVEEVLFEEEFALAVPHDHPLADGDEPVPLSTLQGERLLLLDEGHCLRTQALSVCEMVGADELSDFRATSLETLRMMVAAGVGMTLLPNLAIQPPAPSSPDVTIRRFAEPAPRRQIAMYRRRGGPYADFLSELADLLRDLPGDMVSPAA